MNKLLSITHFQRFYIPQYYHHNNNHCSGPLTNFEAGFLIGLMIIMGIFLLYLIYDTIKND